ncbi:hypothetical protein J437_LFUL014346, partial [Ladona fulva]
MAPHDGLGIKDDGLGDESDVSTRLDFDEAPAQLAHECIGETPEERAAALELLRHTINSRMELPDRTEDDFLIKFLRARGFCVEKAYRLMVRYYKFKEEHPKFHKGVYPLRLTFIGDDDVISVFPYRDQTGRRTIIYR